MRTVKGGTGQVTGKASADKTANSCEPEALADSLGCELVVESAFSASASGSLSSSPCKGLGVQTESVGAARPSRVERHWLDWSRPALPAAVDWIVSRHAREGRIDLRQVILVTPAARSRKRLLQLLSDASKRRELVFLPGETMTVGSLPERLYTTKLPLAGALECRLAWLAALESAPQEKLERIAPGASLAAARARLAFAAQLQQLHELLGAEAASLRSVMKHVDKGNDDEQARWQTLAELQDHYYDILEKRGYWDRHAARNVAVRHGQCHCERSILLVGTADLNEITRRLLAASGAEVAAMFFSPPDGDGGFDEWGVLRPEWWTDRPIPVSPGQLVNVHRPLDQAFEVCQCLARLPADLCSDDVTVCAPDEEVAVHVARQLQVVGLPARRLAGKPLSETCFGRLVEAVFGWLRMPGFDALATLARHPDLFAALSRKLGQEDWLTSLDEFQNRYLPARIDLTTLKKARRQMQQTRDGVASAFAPLAMLLEWLDDFAGTVGDKPVGPDKRSREKSEPEKRPGNHLSSTANWRRFLARIFDDSVTLEGEGAKAAQSLSENRPGKGSDPNSLRRLRKLASDPDASRTGSELEAISVAERFFDEVDQAACSEEQHKSSEGSGGEAGLEVLTVGELLLERLASESAVESPNEPDATATGIVPEQLPVGSSVTSASAEAIELAGWLDLALDDARAVIVTGMNEHNWPSEATGSPLLPDRLRLQLQLPGDERRYARDAWTLGMILNAREHVWLISGRSAGDGSPLLPSRLLFAADAETVRDRAEAFFSFKGKAVPRRWMHSPVPPARRQRLAVPRPVALPAISRLSVTRLREYLKCPYRFYLGQILELGVITDDAREMDGGIFGDLAHHVLEDFGNSVVANSADPDEIATFLAAALGRHSRTLFPFPAWPAERLQIANLGRRLARFARLQAARRRDGWQIVRVEPKVEGQVSVDGIPFTLAGRIDRVDRHDDGRLAVWDYKTSDLGTTAEKAHRHAGNWIDFQLPVYRRLVGEVLPEARDQPDQIGLGYILLPRDLNEIRFDPASWSPEELQSADEAVVSTLRKIRAGEFWPPAAEPPEFSEDFAVICQDEVLEPWSIDGGETNDNATLRGHR